MPRWISRGLGAAALLLTLLACRPAAWPTSPIKPVTLSARRILDQETVKAGSKGWGCWPSGIVATPDGYWFSSRAPGRIYRVEGDAFVGSSSIDQDVVLEAVSRIGDVEYLVDADRQMIVAYKRGEASAPVTRAATMVGADAIGAGSPDGTPTAAAHLDTPLAVAATPDGALVVTETAAGRVRRLELGGTIRTLCEGLDTPTSLAVGPDGSVVVVEAGTGRVVRWQETGGRQDVVRDLPYPDSVAVASDGTVWITGVGDGMILAVRPDGRQQPCIVPGLQDPGPVAVDGQTLLLIDRADASVWRTDAVPATADTSS
jgi:glucose/arabinose dehydrogenase